ncbi:MAG: toll/interleukin-1 receptor domain-containing protein [Nevskiaceae bacterium]|nr:MAG: toll/interleukin-1 receptor domain-containing protein [Nevskiaceae bacterium]
MALKVFISYSTKDIQIVDFVKSMLAGARVQVFVAEYSVAPGTPLSPAIITAIKQCDLFILLWSQNSRASEWVPQEIGIAKCEGKKIVPVVLQSNLHLPGFISDLKYLDVPKNPQGAFTWLRDNVVSQASEKQKQESAAWLAIGGALLWLLSRS